MTFHITKTEIVLMEIFFIGNIMIKWNDFIRFDKEMRKIGF